jgi:hypothetical protein
MVLGRSLANAGVPRRIEADTNLVTVKNDSGAARRRGEVLEFTDLAFTNLDGGHGWLVGGEPALENGFGVLLNPIPDGKLGNEDCQISGACIALVDVSDEGHQYAEVVAGEYVLQSAASGPVRIVWKPSGTGEKTCFVMLGQAPADPKIYLATCGWVTSVNQIEPGEVLGGFSVGGVNRTIHSGGMLTDMPNTATFRVPTEGTYHFGWNGTLVNDGNTDTQTHIQVDVVKVLVDESEERTEWTSHGLQGPIHVHPPANGSFARTYEARSLSGMIDLEAGESIRLKSGEDTSFGLDFGVGTFSFWIRLEHPGAATVSLPSFP